MESLETARYGELINSGRILRFYLEELREVESLGISMLQLIIAPTARAIEQGKQLIPLNSLAIRLSSIMIKINK